jgi:hypothetical protein
LPPSVLIDLASMGVDVGGDLGPQRRREHLPGAIADDLIEQRSTTTIVRIGTTRAVLADWEVSRTHMASRSLIG